jgi:hypothetical protein
LNSFKYQPEVINCRDFSKYDINAINNDLLNADWEQVYNSQSSDTAYARLKNILMNTLDRYAPLIQKTVKGKPSPWLNNELKRHMNIRDQLHRRAQKSKHNDDWSAYRRKRNFVKNELVRSKRSYFQSKLVENRSKPDRLWKIIKTIYPVKDITKCSSAKTFKIGECLITDKSTIAEEFCKFFTTVASKLKEKAFPLTNFTWKFHNPASSNPANNFQFHQVPEQDILKELKHLNRKCATGLDHIPTCYLKDTAYVITKPLCYVINLSLQTGLFPSELKVARVTPIFKSGRKDSFDNYRPISILPALSKIFEKCVHKQLMNYLEVNGLLSENQFGFRKNRSTEHAVVFFTDQIRKAMDKGQLTGAVFIDLSKAFDTISHDAIINKLHIYGITGIAKQWLTSYLFCRKQQVSFQGTFSSTHNVYCGVPQGSILGPLLFVLHFNDSVDSLSACSILMYADDTVMYYSDKDINTIQNHLEKDFISLAKWLTENELIINSKKGKTEIMIFGTSPRLKKLNSTPLTLLHNDISLNITNSYKYLGITLTNSLNMVDYLAATIKKASSRLHLLRKMRSYMDTKTASLIYQAMIVPVLTYCSLSLYGSTPPHINTKIAAMEDRARFVIGNGYTIQRTELIKRKRLCTFVHKCIHSNNLSSIFEDYYTMRNTNINTRNNGTQLQIPKIKLEIARKSTFYQGTILFNNLPRDIRQENNFIIFKKKLNEFSS